MLAAGVVALVLVVVARAVAASAGSAEQLVGNPAPFLNLPVEHGGVDFPETVSLAEQHGHPVLIVFFYTLCTHCLDEMQTTLQVSRASTATHLTTLYVDTPDEDAPVVQEFAARIGISQPVLIDFGGKVAQRYSVTFFPTIVLLDGQGTVRHVWTGNPSASAIERQVQAVAQAPGASK